MVDIPSNLSGSAVPINSLPSGRPRRRLNKDAVASAVTARPRGPAVAHGGGLGDAATCKEDGWRTNRAE
jgi:hypothetical protein